MATVGGTPLERDKADWRMLAIRNRRHLSIDHARVRAGLERFLMRQRPSGWVVAYAAMPGEPDLGPLLERRDLARFALTRTPAAGRDLTVHPADVPLETHRFGFRQPIADAPVVPDAEIEMVLVPGLAFDLRGGRLGHGAGYYDRFLGRLERAVLRIGVTDGYLVSALPVEPHDVPMTHLASEIGVVELSLP